MYAYINVVKYLSDLIHFQFPKQHYVIDAELVNRNCNISNYLLNMKVKSLIERFYLFKNYGFISIYLMTNIILINAKVLLNHKNCYVLTNLLPKFWVQLLMVMVTKKNLCALIAVIRTMSYSATILNLWLDYTFSINPFILLAKITRKPSEINKRKTSQVVTHNIPLIMKFHILRSNCLEISVLNVDIPNKVVNYHRIENLSNISAEKYDLLKISINNLSLINECIISLIKRSFLNKSLRCLNKKKNQNI
jgi:hypothetical protein